MKKNNFITEGEYIPSKSLFDSSWKDRVGVISLGRFKYCRKKDIINKVDFVFISSENPNAYDNAKEKLKKQGVNHNLLDCSDAHNNSSSDLKDRIGKCFTWIKADTTFEGLRQVLYEFDDRVFVGDIPPSKEKVEKNPTKFLKALSIRKVAGVDIPELWFDRMPDMEFNSGLVAIVGNKGTGKSAIADILGLHGNSHNYNDFSFLNPKKFLKKKPYHLSSAFESSLQWQSGYKTDFKHLSNEVDYSTTEKIKYLPQNFFRKNML
ncbi:MAG: hypothetical protein HC831_09875 [Chloroflexia bacterium]|nr:hypothetical protein [Chloroflexia bacterium]